MEGSVVYPAEGCGADEVETGRDSESDSNGDRVLGAAAAGRWAPCTAYQ